MSDWKMLNQAFAAALKIVRKAPDPVSGYEQLLDLARSKVRSKLWAAFGKIDVVEDVQRLRRFLLRELTPPNTRSLTGLYFGLDTLNMRGGRGKNLEMAGSSKFDTQAPFEFWNCEFTWSGGQHLIRGLHAMYKLYHPLDDYDLSQFIEIPIWVGYTGLVLAQAFREPKDRILVGKTDRRAIVWGHHDGDLMLLGHVTPTGFETK